MSKKTKKILRIVFTVLVIALVLYIRLNNVAITVNDPSLPTESQTEQTSPPTTPENKDGTTTDFDSYEDFDIALLPEYEDVKMAYIYINDNVPFFEEDEITDDSFEAYSELDDLNRCGVAYGCLSTDTQPKDGEKRGNISSVKPTGWTYNKKSNNNKYDCVEGSYVYNRCHLFMYAMSDENDNELNLITGTRYLNIDGMLTFEDVANDYINKTGNHIMYRVTPYFEGDNLVADGVLMECYSVEDNGEGVQFCVWCYNVQPGIGINYATGENWYTGEFYDTTAKSVKVGE